MKATDNNFKAVQLENQVLRKCSKQYIIQQTSQIFDVSSNSSYDKIFKLSFYNFWLVNLTEDSKNFTYLDKTF